MNRQQEGGAEAARAKNLHTIPVLLRVVVQWEKEGKLA